MKSAGKARNNGLYRHIRTSKEIIRNLLNDSFKNFEINLVVTFCTVSVTASSSEIVLGRNPGLIRLKPFEFV